MSVLVDYKLGDRVIYVGQDDESGVRRRGNSRFYPEIGTLGIVHRVPTAYHLLYNDEVIVQWPDGSTSGDDMWFCKCCLLEPCSQHELLDKADFTELDAFLNEIGED